jgi:hypothetical protein
VRVFEVDSPQTQMVKRETLQKVEIPRPSPSPAGIEAVIRALARSTVRSWFRTCGSS